MFALTSKKEFVVRITLIAVILFNAFASNVPPVQANQEPVSMTGSRFDRMIEEAVSIPTFERPVPRVGEGRPDDFSRSPQTAVTTETNANSPIMFIENVGQYDPEIRFVVHSSNGALVITNDVIWLTIQDIVRSEESALPDNMGNLEDAETNKKLNRTDLKITFPDSNPHTRLEPYNRVHSSISFFYGDDAEKWKSNVPAWRGIRYVDFIPGADLEISDKAGLLSWELALKDSKKFLESGLLSTALNIHVAGHKKITLDTDVVTIKTELNGDIVLPNIGVRSYDSPNHKFANGNLLLGNDEISITFVDLGEDETTTESLLTPTQQTIETVDDTILFGLGYSTFFFGDEEIYIAVDDEDAIYVTGNTSSVDLPVTPGSLQTSYNGGTLDAFVAKLNPEGSELEYATYLGGNSYDFANGIVVDNNGSAYIGGGTSSSNFPKTTTFLVQHGGFIAKLSPTGNILMYSTIIGGNDVEDIVLDEELNAYLATSVGGANVFPTTYGAYDRTYNGPMDVGLSKLNANGNVLLYSTFLGSTNSEVPTSIAVNNLGEAYVAGWTTSPAFPTVNAYDNTLDGAQDGFISKINSTGSNLVFSTFVGGAASSDRVVDTDISPSGNLFFAISPPSSIIGLNSSGSGLVFSLNLAEWGGFLVGDHHAIDLDDHGNVYVVGQTSSPDFPTTNNAYDETLNGIDLFLLQLSTQGTLKYSTFFGGSVQDTPFDIAVSDDGHLYFAGYTESTDFPILPGSFDTSFSSTHPNNFVAKLLKLPIIPDLSSVGEGNSDACFAKGYSGAQGYISGPINTHTGGYDYTTTDISLPTSAGDLTFQREYTSLSIDNPTVFSPGWTHNQDSHLIFPDDPGGLEDRILFKAHTANQYIFTINGDGTYSAYPGLCSTLVYQQGNYIVKDSGQNTYTFDSTGVLQSFADAQGHTWDYIYVNGKLDLIEANGGSVSLGLEYDTEGRIVSVSDQTDRIVEYSYVSTGELCPSGNLCSVDDVMGQTWTYEYDQNLDYLLTRVAAPGNVTIEQTVYDSNTGQAIEQYDGEGNLVAWLRYNPDGTVTIKDSVNDANPETHTYDERGTLRVKENGDGGQQEKHYDFNFRPDLITDPLDNPTVMEWSDNGTNLEYIKDALEGETSIYYDDPENPNGPTRIIDPMQFETEYIYDNPYYPTLLSRIKYPLSFDNGSTWVDTDYDYYTPSSGASAGKVMTITDVLGNQTFYTYYSSGQIETVTTAYGTPDALTTRYGYDSLGRLEYLTDEQGIVTYNKYDDAGQLIMTVHRAYPSDFNPNTFIQNLVIGDGIYNIVTRYRYDPRGNQIAVVDTNWVITRTYYDLASRPVGMVQNLVINGTPPASEADVTAAISMAEGDVPAFDPAHPDRNIHSTTEYDDAGNVFATTDPEGITARTFYDEANRPSLTIQNFSGTGAYNPVYPDQNIRTQYFYDANGNVIATKDTLDIYTRTYYDSLNRPKIIIQNWVGSDIYNDPAPNRALGECGSTINVCTENFYDKNGNLIAVQDPNGIYTRTYYDALNRTVAVVQNLAGKSYTDPALPDPGQGECGTDVNICSFTYYDEAGNVMATVDPRGVVTRTYYDSANRPVTIVNNLVNWDIYLDTPPARGNGLSDENVRTDIDYDSFGRRDIVTDPFERVTKYEYNQVGQLAKVTTNYVNGGDPQNDDDQRNIVTAYEYDALGRQVKTIDTMGRVSLSVYDDLGRVITFTQNYHETYPPNHEIDGDRFNIVTTYDYDAHGNQIGMTDSANIKTRTYYDALGRPVTTVRNLTGAISNPTPPERSTPPDSETNLRTDTIYLGNGSVDYVRDEMGEITDYGYDDLGRLTTVLDPLLHSTSYEFDANGNRTLMIDAESISTRYEYDGLNRLKAVVENYRPAVNPDHEINVRTEYTYDAGGNRLSILDGNNHSTFFTYTAFGRVETETDALGNDHTYEYDSMGNRRSALDANDALTVFDYDELNRLIAIDYPGTDSDASFEYDALGHRLSMTDGLGTTTWDYNNLDQPNYIRDPFSAQVSYEYNEVGNRDKLTYPDGRVVDYLYNDVYRLESVTTTGVGTTGYEYDAVGRLKAVTRPNNVSTSYNYYDNGWLQDISHTAGAETLSSYQYQYYDDGNRSRVVENVQNPGFAYGDLDPGYELATYDNFKFTSLITSTSQTTTSGQSQSGQTLPESQQVDFSRLPLSFVANVGQFGKDITFQTNSLGGSIFFTPSEVVLALVDKKDVRIKDSEEDTAFTESEAKVVRIEYKNAEKDALVEGLELLPGVAHFMVGTDKKAWAANAPTYDGIVYRNLYPGVDLTYEGAGNSLKSTFLVAAGADPNLIQWRYKGAGNVNLDADGNLLVTLPSKKVDGTETTLIEHAPVAWQEVAGQRVDVPVEYALAQNGEISFVFPDGYDATLPLVIDPVLTYSTYLGNIGTDVGTAITTDASGNVYVTGYSWCGNFPTVDPITGVTGDNGEVIVSKISADGSTLLYSTCVGGTGDDFGKSIALDTQGRIVVAGVTNSTDFPIVSGIGTYGGGTCSSGAPCQDTFVLALNSDGSAIRYSTYLGGDGREEVGGMAVDSNDKIIVVGSTTSTNFPTANAFDTTFGGGTCTSSWPCYDVTVTKIDPDLSGTNSILYSTYLGGVGRDKGYGAVLDSTGKVYLVGYSDSDGYPVRNALQATRKGGVDIIVSQIDPSLSGDASLLYSTYFGSTNQENGFAIARDSDGNLYLTGRVSSPRFPLRDALQYLPHSSGTCSGTSCYEAFVTKIDISINQIIYSTYLGGTQNEEGYGIAVDAYGRAYVTGFTRSTDFPTFDPIQAAKGADGCASTPCADAFLSVLEADGRSFAYSTYLGGDQEDISNGITVDVNNNVYIIGETYSTNFPTTPGAYDVINTQTTFRDAFISKVGALGTPAAPAFSHLDSVVSASSDDAEENASGSSVNLTSTELELTQAATNQKVGLRFTGIDLPPGAVIQNAWIQFTVSTTQASADATTLTFQAQASDNAPTFAASANNISSRTRTSASVSWAPAAWNTFDEGGPDQRTPDLAAVIQEVVDRPGWTSGNAIAIIVTGSGKRVAKTYDRDPYGAAYLHIEFTLAPPPGELGLQITANPTSFTGAGQNISYTYTLTNIGTVPLNGPYTVSDDTVASVDCSAAQNPLPVGQATTCVGSYTTTAADVTAGSITNSATVAASDGTGTITSDVATATVTLQVPPSGPVTINYVYDPLNRLTEANYLETGDFYHYAYDAVGNRLTQDTLVGGLSSATTYIYKDNNVIDTVNGVPYVYDNNGNLKNDGVNAYTYTSNKLSSISGENLNVTFQYRCNGESIWQSGCESDRVSQTVNGVTTNYVLDIASPLTQVLQDGTNTYLYGIDRIAQISGATPEYFLTDGLGSVRQLVDSAGNITLAKGYQPYGTEISSTGSSLSSYGFTGEMTDPTGLIYLRARYYDPTDGRFFQKDPSRQEKNLYQYAGSNPIMYTDPSGLVYLTFDDGPNYPADMQILTILAQHKARATFFFHGSSISPSTVDKLIVWRVVTEGHHIGNHGWSPEKLTDTDVDSAIQSVADTENLIVHTIRGMKTANSSQFNSLNYDTQSYINGVIEHGTGLFRPHGGYIKQSQLRAIECKNIWGESTECDSRLRGPLDVSLWDVDPRDWEAHNPKFYSTDPSEILSRLCNGVWWDLYSTPNIKVSIYNRPVTSNSDVILLHSYEETASVLPEILDTLSSMGYTFDVLEPSWR